MPLAESAFGAVARVGPYFSVVSLLPAAGLTYTTYVLVCAQPWTGNPSWSDAYARATDVSLGGALLGAFAVTVIALVLHPLQFAVVQMLEGYWGVSGPARLAARWKLRHHAVRWRHLEKLWSSAEGVLSPESGPEPARADAADARWLSQESTRLQSSYPSDPDEIMPTRLGNILRRYERLAGNPYGLDVVVVASHLAQVAAPSQVAYLRDQRTQLDLGVRLAFTSALLAIITTLLFAASGWWVLLAVGPYLFAGLFYRGACVVAHHYGVAMQTTLDLNRAQLYRALGVPLPSSLVEERRLGAELTAVLGDRDQDVRLLLRWPS